MIATQVLVVEDDHGLRDVLARGLRAEGFHVRTAVDGTMALRTVAQGADLVVLDIGLPDSDGRDVCQAMRGAGVTAPVLFLTSRDQLTDRLNGFAVGGDDYLAKPFHFDELVARLTALNRRHRPQAATSSLVLDPAAHAVVVGGKPFDLTPTEYRLLGALFGAAGTVVRRRQLRQAGWPHGGIVSDNTLDQYVARLRRKLSEADSEPRIHTVRGVGWRLQE